jgi:AcrR family transcriptional regulator
VAVRSPAQEEKRRRILEAAVRAFARKGYHACRVGEIATEAGVAYGLVYHYFTSKDEILETIFRETWTQMLTAIEAVEEDGVPAGEQLRKVAAIVLRTWKRDPDLVRVLVREVTRSQHIQREVEEIEHAYAALQRIVERGQDSGEFRDDLEPRLAALIVYGALEEILTSWVMGQLDDSDEDVDRAEKGVVTLLRDGLRVRPSD